MELDTKRSVWTGACVTGLGFNHILSISVPRKSPLLEQLGGQCTVLV